MHRDPSVSEALIMRSPGNVKSHSNPGIHHLVYVYMNVSNGVIISIWYTWSLYKISVSVKRVNLMNFQLNFRIECVDANAHCRWIVHEGILAFSVWTQCGLPYY
jgi:hypothetical protein